eukprot:TRINITY_DN570_c1_g1_i1.p1 TRINITY_DN570_c1_g1~~TRINITY_DN570_c1_g1_i1.p1  ORF type:complete len:927 (+),score=309.49 TRINITY_DN570_c1_g1_i1:83-2782(+)
MAAGLAAALIAAGAGALPPLPCATSGQSYLSCPAEWKFVGPASYVNAPDVLRREGLEPMRRRSDDDDTDDFLLEDSVPRRPVRRGRVQRGRDDFDDKDDEDDWALGYDYGYEGSDRDDVDDARDKGLQGKDAEGLASASATHAVVEARPGEWLAATVNGGVWRSNDIAAARPHWVNVLDGQPVRCSAISALAVSPHDKSRVLAGCGPSTSGELGRNQQVLITGDWGGVMESRDGGDTWAMLDAFPVNYYVTGFAFPSAGSVLVSAYSHFYNDTDGGVWRSSDDGKSFTRTLGKQAFNLLRDPKTNTVVASGGNDDGCLAYRSADEGRTWVEWGAAATFGKGILPYYSCLTITPSGVVFLGSLARRATMLNDTTSAIWYRSINDVSGQWTRIANQPANLDQDLMSKDRMAVLVDPKEPSILYVAGNAGSVVYRVRWAAAKWEEMWGAEAKGTIPHSDCRNFAWDAARDALLLTSDGGIFARLQPRTSGGVWISLAGDIGAMEIVQAAWDAELQRWVGGAQDNGVQLSPPQADGRQQALSIIMGDGCLTEVDNQHRPSRIWGSTQHLAGLGFYEGNGTSARGVTLPLTKFFPDPLAVQDYSFRIPFFNTPWTLNTQRPSELVVWIRGYGNNASAFYSIDVPQGVQTADDVPWPKKIVDSDGADIHTFVAGGRTEGRPDPSLIVAMNDSHFFYYSAATKGKLVVRKLPAQFAPPVVGPPPSGLGPQSHGKLVFVAVSPADSRTAAITGWSSADTNTVGKEGIWVTNDAGLTWTNVFGDLAAASCTVGKARPQGMLYVDFPEFQASSLLVGTATGVFVSWTDRPGKWSRLGQCADLPLVMVTALTHEGYSDTLVAATYGRGVYVLHGLRKALAAARNQQLSGKCDAPPSPLQTTSDQFLPPRQ